MTIKAIDADSSITDYNVVRFDYVGNESPPKADGSSRFNVSEDGRVLVVSSLDKNTVSTITFVVRARDGIPSGISKFSEKKIVTA